MNIALVAHDSRKQELIEWVKYNLKELSKHNLYATGTTAKKLWEIEDNVGYMSVGGNSDGDIA